MKYNTIREVTEAMEPDIVFTINIGFLYISRGVYNGTKQRK